MIVYPYIRFSLEESRKGISEQDQIERITAYHAKELSHIPLFQGADPRRPFEECTDRAVSAYKRRFTKRPAGQFIDERIKKGDVLILAYYDRGFRKVWDALHTIEKYQCRKVKVVILDYLGADIETFEGLASLTIGALMSEGHSKRLSARMKSVVATRKKHDLTVGGGKSKILLGFKVVRIKRKELGIDTNQILFDPKQLPLLKKYHDAWFNRTVGEPTLQQQLTDEKRRELGLPLRPFAFIDNPKEKVSIETVERAAYVYELVQPYLAAGCHVPYHEIQKQVQDRAMPKWPARLEKMRAARAAQE